MPKNRKRNTSIMNRSDIPLAQRKLMEKHATNAAHRDDAAKNALQLACVALNNTEGLGYLRLARFVRELQALTNEFYSDPEVGAAHLKTRLEQLGFMVSEDGRMYAVEDSAGEIVKLGSVPEAQQKQLFPTAQK